MNPAHDQTHDPAHDPAWARLLARARASLERTGGALNTTISLSEPSEEERRVIIGVTGVYRATTAGRVAVRLADLDQYLNEAHATTLSTVVQKYSGTPLRDRHAERQREAQAREAALAQAMRCRHAPADWYGAWLEGLRRDGSVTRLIRSGADFSEAVKVLDALPARDEPMPAFCERLLGDTKALADGSLRQVLLRALALWQQADPPANAEQERLLWEAAGVVPDDLASQVLVLNLPATGGMVGSWLTQAARAAVPVRLTLHQLRLAPLTLVATAIYVTENPAILRAACALGPGAPALVCTEGVPSAAAHRLLSNTDATLWWRNDFDWPGIRMTATALARYPNARPWRMSAGAYRAHAGTGPPLVGAPAATPWDQALGAEMLQCGRAVMEERLLPELLHDLHPGWGEPDLPTRFPHPS